MDTISTVDRYIAHALAHEMDTISTWDMTLHCKQGWAMIQYYCNITIITATIIVLYDFQNGNNIAIAIYHNISQYIVVKALYSPYILA